MEAGRPFDTLTPIVPEEPPRPKCTKTCGEGSYAKLGMGSLLEVDPERGALEYR